jgi:hypothetical protein
MQLDVTIRGSSETKESAKEKGMSFRTRRQPGEEPAYPASDPMQFRG